MPSFRYTAITPAGDVVKGAMDAVSVAAVIEALRRQGQIPVQANAASGGGVLARLLSSDLGGGSRLRRQDVANMTRELSIMLGAGQDLDRALRFLVETAPNKRVGGVLDQLRAGVRDGASLATTLGRFPSSFSRLYVGLVRAGEAGGALAATLERLAVLLERERSLSATVTSAMIYPSLLLMAAIGAIALLLAGLALRQALRRPGFRLPFDRFVLRLPVLGRLTREIVAARFSRTLGTLLVNGMPLIAALDTVRDAIGNLAAVGAVEIATGAAKGGGGLSRALGDSGVFPIRTIYLLRLGEETAQLGAMALRAAEIHEENTRIGVQRLISLLTPTITIVMGAAVAGIVSSLLLAMLSLNDLAN